MPDNTIATLPPASPKPVRLNHHPGHFYSPIVDPAELESRRASLWPEQKELLGIDFNDAYHLRVLEEWFPQFMHFYDYPEASPLEDTELKSFYTQNSQFSWLDSRALLVLMCAWRPQRIIEVGSGYSSILMADVNRRHLAESCKLTCIEPYPRPFLLDPDIGIAKLIEEKVQDVPLDLYSELSAGDILFIDSSHVAKTGSDVNHLFFEVIPRLASGVRIHVHDIFLPNEYPVDWVLEQNRSWNEQYLLRALLMNSNRYRVLFGCSYAFDKYPQKVQAALQHPKGHGFAGGSFWFEVV